MREEVVSPGTVEAVALARSSSPPLTPAASSAAASSSHGVPVNIDITDWLGGAQVSKTGSLSSAAQVPSNSDNLGNSASGSSHFSCRPWERGDLLRRLATFKPSNWFAKPQGASSLTCARRGWVNIGTDKIECESCGLYLYLTSAGEAFIEKLDSGHNITCPWRGKCCADSLAQFPPSPLSALIGGYKDRCDGLLQFSSLPVIASSAIEAMRLTRSAQIDRLLLHSQFSSGELGFKADNMPVPEISREDAFCHHNQVNDPHQVVSEQAQKLISLCGWEPRWLPNVQDCEEHSTQSARNECSFVPNEDEHHHTKFPEFTGNAFSASARRNRGKEKLFQEWRCDTKSPLLDCGLCGATIRVWDFQQVPRPARFGPNNIDSPDTCKKLVLTRGVSAASGINGWIAADEEEKEQIEGRDEAATNDEGKSLSNADINLDLTIGNGFQSTQSAIPAEAGPLDDGHLVNGDIGRDLMIGQPAGSEVGDRAASFESRGPSSRKRFLEEGGSTVDRPQDRIQQTDSIEGTLIDHNVDGIDEEAHETDSLSKRARSLIAFDPHHFSCKMDMTGAGPSHVNLGINLNRSNSFKEVSDLAYGNHTRDSARASSVIALDIICSDDQDSMESVENYPGGISYANVNSMNIALEFNYSNQAQQSTFIPHAAGSFAREMGGSSTIDGEEIQNEVTFTDNARDRISLGISGGSVGMGASHEAEIRGVDASLQQADSTIGDTYMIGEVTEIVGQSVESAPGPGLMDEFVPELVREEPHSDSQNMISRSVSKADSASKIYGSVKADSIESGKKMGHMLGNDRSAHLSLSCNALLCSGNEASRGEVMQMAKERTANDFLLDSDNGLGNGLGPPIGENDYNPEGGEFDPIKHHNIYCPWVNENVAAAGYSCDMEPGSSVSAALCGWQLTLDALDSFLSLGHIPCQMMQSESAASLCKDDHLTPRKKNLTSQSGSKSRGRHFD